MSPTPSGARTFVFCRTRRPLRGCCPSCEMPLDALGCRVVDHYRPPRDLRRQSGIAEVFQVICRGESRLPEITCPCCAQHPGERCPGASA